MLIEYCEGYKKLMEAVERDENKYPGSHDYRAKLKWIVDRAQHYADKLGLEASAILNSWESKRDYWYMNFYQDANQPEIKGDKVRAFETLEDFQGSIKENKYRCPMCGGVSTDPYVCNSGLEMGKGKICDWKSYGLFHCLGKGVYVFIKDSLYGSEIFMPIAWESQGE